MNELLQSCRNDLIWIMIRLKNTMKNIGNLILKDPVFLTVEGLPHYVISEQLFFCVEQSPALTEYQLNYCAPLLFSIQYY